MTRTESKLLSMMVENICRTNHDVTPEALNEHIAGLSDEALLEAIALATNYFTGTRHYRVMQSTLVGGYQITGSVEVAA